MKYFLMHSKKSELPDINARQRYNKGRKLRPISLKNIEGKKSLTIN